MTYLVDTNVVSEFAKPRPDSNVERWANATPEEDIFLSVMTFAEIRLGIEIMAESRRRSLLLAWLENDLPARFEGRIIPIGAVVADICGRLIARAQRSGRRLGIADALLAATAEAHQLTLVTRNTGDFDRLGIALLNPWLGGI